ncbi:hypothetical protein RB195_003746 [Necator americanus]|uniref:Uncharacterized protein n=1 Tax=Necator americanus TaxID=51031 RepID=A0ABR1DPY8_NECAM
MIAHFWYILLVLTAFANYGVLGSCVLECKDFLPSKACRNFEISTKLCSDPTKKDSRQDGQRILHAAYKTSELSRLASLLLIKVGREYGIDALLAVGA